LYPTHPDIEEISTAAESRLQRGTPGVVAVSGFGGSGKSTLASKLGRRLGAPVVGIDEFGTAGVFTRSRDWCGLDRARLVGQVLKPLKDGERLITYDSCHDWETWHSEPVTIEIDRVLVLEGIGMFHPLLLPFFDYRVWLDVDLATATHQGTTRELAEGRDPGSAWKDIWEPNDVDFFASSSPMAAADLVVTCH
jgi:uridine kinase